MAKKLTSQAEQDASNNGMELDPIIDALLLHLPAPGEVFAPEDRKLWLQILELCLKLIYMEQHEPEGDAPTEQQHGGQA